MKATTLCNTALVLVLAGPMAAITDDFANAPAGGAPVPGGKGPGMGHDYRRNVGGPGMGPTPTEAATVPPSSSAPRPAGRGYPGWPPGMAAPYGDTLPGYVAPRRGQGYGYPGYRGQGGSGYPRHRQYGNPPGYPPVPGYGQ